MKKLIILLPLILLLVLQGCSSPGPQKPDTSAVEKVIESSDLSDLDANLYEKAIATLDAGEAKSATKQLLRLEKKNPAHLGIKINLATAYFLTEKVEDAKKIANRAHSINENIAALQNLLGLIAIEQKQFTDAEKAYLKAIKLDNKLANAHYNLALLYDQYYQDIPKAYQYYQNYLKLVPDDQETTDWVEQLKYSLE